MRLCVYFCIFSVPVCYIAIASFSLWPSLLSVAIWHLLSGMEGSSPPASVSDAPARRQPDQTGSSVSRF